MTLLAWLVYLPLQVLWLPLSLVGAGWVAWMQIGRSQALGLSQTAVEVLNARWTAHVFGLRRDEASRRLAEVIENNSTAGLRLALFPLMVARRVAGRPFLYPDAPGDAEMKMANFLPTRFVRFDALIDAHADDAEQFVVLGAGLDTRAYGPLAHKGLTMFELDRAPTPGPSAQPCNVQASPPITFISLRWISLIRHGLARSPLRLTIRRERPSFFGKA